LWLFAFPLLLIAPPTCGAADSGSELSEFCYQNGQIEAEYLPYNKKFVLTGSTALPRRNVDFVTLRTQGIDKHLCWQRPEGDTTKRFRIIVPALTSLHHSYEFTLTYYAKLETVDPQTRVLVDATIEALLKLEREPITDEDVRNSLEQQLEQLNSASESSSERGTLVLYPPDCGRIKRPFPSPGISEQLAMSLGQASLQLKTIREKSLSLATAEEGYEKWLELNADSLERTMTRMQESARLAASRNQDLGFTEEDIQLLQDAVHQIEEKADTIRNSPALRPNQWRQPIPRVNEGLLGELRQHARTIFSLKHNLDAKLAAYQNTENTVLEEVKSLLGQYVTEELSVSFAEDTSAPQTEINRLRIGTAYGYYSALLSGAGIEHEGFAAVALKYYWSPVDRSLKNPFPTWKSRWSFTLGSVFSSDIGYKGQEQDDAFGGLKPMIGINYDRRLFGLNAGIVLFRQPSVNPLAAGVRSDVRIAPFLGMTFEFDALNRIRDLLKES
jgi:hypothetical protein